jgi:hypothetical protein
VNFDQRWTRHVFYRSERIRTTWKFRIALVVAVVLAVWLIRPWWTIAVASSLVCDGNPERSDALLVENFDHDYSVFWRAAQLRRSGMAGRVLVPIATDPGGGVNAVERGVAGVMAGAAGLGDIDIVPVREVEPISLNVAWDLLGFLEREAIRSVIVVSPIFRSRRSALVYGATLSPAGVRVTCEPTKGTRGVDDWPSTMHGIQNVTEQWFKLQYYRIYVLPFRLH